jgi:transposase
MNSQLQAVNRLAELFAKRKCWMIDELAEALGYAVISVRRFLNAIGYFRSYSHNGKWYTLGSTPRFNRDGVWVCDQICFSRYGSLTETITHLIGKSPAGLSAKELGNRLDHRCHSVLMNLYKAERIDRVKVDQQFVYLSTEGRRNRAQREALKARTMPLVSRPFTAETAVFVLVEFIKHPQSSLEQIARYVKENRGIQVSSDGIARFLDEHDLKKTAVSRSSRP